MIEINISKDVVNWANDKLSKISPKSNQLSKFGVDLKRILIGYIGEKIVMDYLGIKEDADTYDYDIIRNGKRLEVKTISCKFKPKPFYSCTVNSHDPNGIHKQDADYYIFTRILNDNSKGWILGYIPCKEFFEKGKFIEKGTDLGKFSFTKANATIISIQDLKQFK